jgi:hypothetical protein
MGKIEAFLQASRTKQIMTEKDMNQARHEQLKMQQNCSYELADQEAEYELRDVYLKTGKTEEMRTT